MATGDEAAALAQGYPIGYKAKPGGVGPMNTPGGGEPGTKGAAAPKKAANESTSEHMTPEQATLFAGAHDPKVAAYLQHGYDQGASPWGQVQSMISPLAMQMAFQNTIAPLLRSVYGDQMGTANMLGSTMGGMLNNPNVHLPDAYRSVLASMIPQQEASMKQMAGADFAGAITAPGVDAIMQQVQQAMAAQRLAQYEAEHAIAYGASGNPMAQLSAGVPLVGLQGGTGTGSATAGLSGLTPQQQAAVQGILTGG